MALSYEATTHNSPLLLLDATPSTYGGRVSITRFLCIPNNPWPSATVFRTMTMGLCAPVTL